MEHTPADERPPLGLRIHRYATGGAGRVEIAERLGIPADLVWPIWRAWALDQVAATRMLPWQYHCTADRLGG